MPSIPLIERIQFILSLRIRDTTIYNIESPSITSINGVVVTWVVAIDPPGVRFPLNALFFLYSVTPDIVAATANSAL